MKLAMLAGAVLAGVTLLGCTGKPGNVETIERGSGIYIGTGGSAMEPEYFELISSGYRRSDECAVNEYFVDSKRKCAIGVDADDYIDRGLVAHRQFVKEVDGRKFYRLFFARADGEIIEVGAAVGHNRFLDTVTNTLSTQELIKAHDSPEFSTTERTIIVAHLNQCAPGWSLSSEAAAKG